MAKLGESIVFVNVLRIVFNEGYNQLTMGDGKGKFNQKIEQSMSAKTHNVVI